jgi:hypothetical protein
MNRWAAVLAAAGVSAAALLMFPRVSGAPADVRHEPVQPVTAPAVGTPAAHTDAVQVDHEFVVVQPTPVRAPQPRARPVAAARPARSPGGEPRDAAESPGLATRAGRMLVGDGRYRPEPFPRPASEK